MSQLALHLFGSPRLELDGAPVHIPRRKAMALLAYLAVDGHSYSRDSLATLLWPETGQGKARAELRRMLSTLTQALGSGWVVADRKTVCLNTNYDPLERRTFWLDIVEFRGNLKVGETHNHLPTVSCPDCLPQLETAVELYSGEFMAGFSLKDCPAYDEWQFFQADGLQRELAKALQQLSAYYQCVEEYAPAIEYARRWLELDGLNEAAHRQIMVLYTENGQRTAAFRQYGECVRILDTELSVAPETETEGLYRRIQAGELRVPDEESLIKPWFDRSARHNLSAELSSFIGRQDQIAQVTDQVESHRLVTLVGPGGVGKTRLALKAARAVLPDYANGVWLAQLAPVANPGQLSGAVATTLGLQESGEISLEETLVAFLHTKQLLLVLDNCEHLVEASAQLVAHLLAHCPELHILATSREALGVPGETPFRVAPLGLPPAEKADVEILVQAEAVQLFVERAVEAFPGFALTATNAPAVREICRRLDGIPLALELAARWVQTLQVEQIAERLDNAFRLLTGGQRTALPRQQTLRATLDWSYNLLSASETVVLRRLAVFAGGWILAASEAVCCEADVEAADVLPILNQLVEKSLVEVARESGQEARYHLLGTVRQYAREKLRDAGEMGGTRDSHMRWFTALAERAEPQLYGHGQLRWLRRLESEHDNLRAALSWALAERDAETALQLSGGLGRFWRIRGYWREGQHWLQTALDMDAETGENANPLWRARAYLGVGMVTGFSKDCVPYYENALHLFQTTGDRSGVGKAVSGLATDPFAGDTRFAWQEPLEESLTFFREAGDHSGLGMCFFALGSLKKFCFGDMQAARNLYERGLAHLRVGRDLNGMGFALGELAWFVWDDGELFRRAQSLMEEALQVHRVIGSPWGTCYNLRNLAWFVARQGDYARAQMLAEEGVSIAREMGVKGVSGVNLMALGQYGFFYRGEIEQAQVCLEEAVSLARDVGHLRILGVSLSFLGNIHRHKGELLKAAQLFEESLGPLQEGNIASGLWRVQMYKGDLARTQGDYAEAGALYRESLKMIEERGRRLPDVPRRLDGLAMVAARLDQYQRGVQLFGAVQALREHMGTVVHPVDRAEYDQHLALVREVLGETAFNASWEAGRTMTADDAIAYALDQVP